MFWLHIERKLNACKTKVQFRNTANNTMCLEYEHLCQYYWMHIYSDGSPTEYKAAAFLGHVYKSSSHGPITMNIV